ncbi:hypothetical protein M433DRAFT_538296 [Acidomyces richmondensis BFW]|nr:hypothetical protein M433DRAFT_538296 [Acidomyces richmondensis BFW]
MLVAREPALLWDFSEIGRCSLEVQPPELVEMLQERINAGILEPCYGPYRNP